MSIDKKRIEELRDRFGKFNRFELRGQSISMHMGTAYLMADMMSMIEDLARAAEQIEGLK